MTITEMVALCNRVDGLVFEPSVKLHDEDHWNEFDIIYKGIIVGSELVSAEFVINNIKEIAR